MPVILLMLADLPADLPQLGKPVGNMAEWIRDSDFRRDVTGAVRFETIFAPDGTLDRCIITATSGNKALEALVCSIAAKRFKFNPSFGSNGQSAYRVLERMANFSEAALPNGIGLKPKFRLPADGKLKVGTLALIVDVAKDGTLKGCTASPGAKRSADVGRRACEAIFPLWQPLVETNAQGQPVGYVRDMNIDVVGRDRIPGG